MMKFALGTSLALYKSVEAATTLTSGYEVDFALSGDEVTISVTMQTGSWVGLTLGDSGMSTNSDMIQIDADNERVYDMTSAGYRSPNTDSSENFVSTTWSTVSGGKKVDIKRKLDTNDSKDYVIPTDTYFDLGWAVNTSTSTITNKHNKKGNFRQLVSTTGASSSTPSRASLSFGLSAVALAATTYLLF